jgi:hypothetical protein
MAAEKNWTGRNLAPTCLECGVVGAKYKFRCCQKPFCSQSCFSKHTECLGLNTSLAEISEQRIVRTNNYDLNLTDDEILTEQTYQLIRCDKEVLQMLAHPRVQSLLVRLNNSRDRRKTLKRMYSTSALFSNLIDRIGIVLDNGGNSVGE